MDSETLSRIVFTALANARGVKYRSLEEQIQVINELTRSTVGQIQALQARSEPQQSPDSKDIDQFAGLIKAELYRDRAAFANWKLGDAAYFRFLLAESLSEKRYLRTAYLAMFLYHLQSC